MKETKRMLLNFSAFSLAFFVSVAPAWAGGIMLYEIGTPDVGLAAAGWAARAQDAATLFKNPAGMSLLPKSEFQAGAQAAYANVKFSPDSGTNVSGNDGGNAVGWFPGGSLFYVHKLTQDLSVGGGVLSYFGNALKYDDNWVGRYYTKQAILVGYTFTPAASYRITDWLSVGAGLNAMYGTFKQTTALRNLQPGSDGEVKVQDEEWAYGANVGVLVSPLKGLRIGVDYLSEVKLKFKDTPKFSNVGPGLNAILQSRNFSNTQLDLGIRVPQMVMGSVYYDVTSQWAVMANVGWQEWSKFGEIDVTLVDQSANSLTTTSNYQDTWHAAAGVMYKPLPVWTFTGGFGYDSSAVKDEHRPFIFPVGDTYRFGAGAIWQVLPPLKLGFAYEFAFIPNMKVDQFRGPLAGRVSGEYTDTYFHFLSFNVAYQF